MNRPLPKATLERLTAICGLFGSDFAGERAAAAALADKLVRGAGLRWPDVIGGAVAVVAPTSSSVADQIARALKSRRINDWERRFLTSIRDRENLSPRQASCLERISRKVNAYHRRAA